MYLAYITVSTTHQGGGHLNCRRKKKLSFKILEKRGVGGVFPKGPHTPGYLQFGMAEFTLGDVGGRI